MSRYVDMKTEYINSLPQTMEPAARIFAALGDPTRQKILLLFEQGEEISIKTIVELFSFSRTTIVHHLDVLERAGLITPRREGKNALYHANPEILMQALTDLSNYIREEFYEKNNDR
ncbi:metalloregulator ArsR/SmtB family transcription factor [Desulfovibrio sp. OttesenSCG-928-F07]|nr:metalloregulator ArsR/SmtB family transcription factor [Desulfovibrio sp. OttesenSCG-928-F07]